MSIVCSRLPVFYPSKQFHAPRCPRPLLAGTFIDEVYQYIFEKWGVERHGVIWLTVHQNLLPTYQKVMMSQQTVQEECLLDLRSLFIEKKVGLEIFFTNFQLTIRLAFLFYTFCFLEVCLYVFNIFLFFEHRMQLSNMWSFY